MNSFILFRPVYLFAQHGRVSSNGLSWMDALQKRCLTKINAVPPVFGLVIILHLPFFLHTPFDNFGFHVDFHSISAPRPDAYYALIGL